MVGIGVIQVEAKSKLNIVRIKLNLLTIIEIDKEIKTLIDRF